MTRQLPSLTPAAPIQGDRVTRDRTLVDIVTERVNIGGSRGARDAAERIRGRDLQAGAFDLIRLLGPG